ncbi:MAG: hypothetical protein FWH08_06730 [Oscillospiraceae bacterium]|nr:hypothetical protein [Oscillospiraceae bacterium]
MAWDTDIINLDDALTRVMGRKDLYKGWLDAFFNDESLEPVDEAFKNKDYVAAENALHKLKGTAANLSVVKVREQTVLVSEKIKEREEFNSISGDLKKLRKEFYNAKKMYEDNISDLMNYGELIF